MGKLSKDKVVIDEEGKHIIQHKTRRIQEVKYIYVCTNTCA